MRARLAAVTAAAAVALLTLPSHAGVAPQITDPTGDGALPMASLDIVSALFATSGTTAKVGKKTVYTPKQLEVTVTYAAAPETAPGASQAVLFNVTGCGEVLLQRYYDNGTYGSAECLDASFDFTVEAKGNTLQFSLPFNTLSPAPKKGTSVTNLRTWTGGADPVVGFGPTDVDETYVNDTGSTTATYKIS